MEYRILPHGGEKIGVIGMGSSVVGAQKEADIIRTVRTAFDLGVNYFDMAGGHASIFPAYGKALKDIRRQVFLQVHFGADYTTGEYGDHRAGRNQALRRLAAGKPADGLHRLRLHPLSG